MNATNEFTEHESYITPREMLELPSGDFFFFHNFFMKNVGNFMELYGWRYGQCFFNLLMDNNGRVGELLRNSIRDPYHKDEVSEEVWDFVMDNWDKEVAEKSKPKTLNPKDFKYGESREQWNEVLDKINNNINKEQS